MGKQKSTSGRIAETEKVKEHSVSVKSSEHRTS